MNQINQLIYKLFFEIGQFDSSKTILNHNINLQLIIMGNKKLTIVTLLIFTIFLNLNATQSSYNSTTAESRVINVTIDNFFFSLSSSEININENITFNVTNNGGSRHTFTLLDSSFGIDITLNSGENELISLLLQLPHNH